MLLLAIDTCCGKFSIAIFNGADCIEYFIAQEKNQQAELLVTKIEELINKHSMHYDDFDYLACSVGPGSFTGIRIGISALQGIRLVCNKPTIGVSTLEALAVNNAGNALVTVNAGRGQVYSQKFEKHIAKSGIEIMDIEELGNGVKADIVIGELGEGELPDAKLVGLMALRKLEDEKSIIFPLEPLYIRLPDAVEKRAKQNK